MAIKYLNPRFFNGICRYSSNRQIYNNDSDKTYLESTNKYTITQDAGTLYHVVERNEINRLDIIANNYYGDPTLYWAIALANNLIDPFIVNANTLLVIPSFESLYNNDGPLSL